MAKYILGSGEYESKAYVTRKLSAYKEDKPNGHRVDDAEVVQILTALLELDSDATEKIGAGVDHWIVYDNVDLRHNSRGYRVMRVDGTGPIKFGYGDVLKAPSQQALVQRALTDEALDLTLSWRKQQFENGPVETPAGVVTDFLNARAVHASPTRLELHKQFLRSEGLAFNTVALEKRTAPESGYRLADRDLAGRWRRYQEDRLSGLAIRPLNRMTWE